MPHPFRAFCGMGGIPQPSTEGSFYSFFPAFPRCTAPPVLGSPHTVRKNPEKQHIFVAKSSIFSPFEPLLRDFQVIPDNPWLFFGTLLAAGSRNWIASEVKCSNKYNPINEHLHKIATL